MYTDGEYLKKHPTWHVEDSKWKAQQIQNMLHEHKLEPQTICEVGCGAGEILVQLQAHLGDNYTFFGYDISPEALELCKERGNEKLRFVLGDITLEADASFDLLLLVDVIEHIEDYLGFLREVRTKARYKIFHIPLEFTAIAALRRWPKDTWIDLGHIHSFTRDTALQSLRDTGYTIIDYSYTLEFKHRLRSRNVILNLMRATIFSISDDLAVRLLGGCPLLVLTE
jgi:SAM-dependent methyltransferase